MLKGIPASPNIAIGKVFVYEKNLKFDNIQIEETGIENELRRFQEAIIKSKKELAVLQEKAIKKMGKEEASIFEAQRLMLQDQTLIQEVQRKIKSRKNAEAAVDDAVKNIATTFEQLEKQYFRERALDIQDVGERLIKNLLGKEFVSLSKLSDPRVIVANNIMPSDTVNIDRLKVLGFVTAKGGATSHVAIIARAIGIPAVVGLNKITKQIKNEDWIIVDGDTGVVIINPDKRMLQKYRSRIDAAENKKRKLAELREAPAETRDGHRVKLFANLGHLEEVKSAILMGAEGCGLLRTEFLYHERRTLPSENEQVKTYRAIFEEMESKPVIIRTLDIGGDKPPSYFEIPKEPNPFLGWRGIRISLDSKELFKTQLRAILKASSYGNPMIMCPMVSSIEEVRKVRKIIENIKKELKREGVPFKNNIKVGIMVEVPSTALIADIMSNEVDFFSIGTNDLVQYTLAVDRTNEKVQKYFHELHPAVLRLIKKVIESAHAKGIHVGVCGEMAGNLLAAPILLGLGLDEFSMTPAIIPEIKNIIRSMTFSEAKEIAKKAVNLATTAEVRKLVKEYLNEIVS